MSAAHSSPTTVPQFECQLPPGLLNSLSEKDRYMYETIDVMRQSIAYTASLAAHTADKLEAVRVQTTETNGGLKQAKADIIALTEAVRGHQAQTEPVVKAYAMAGKAVRTKTFWVAAILFFTVVAPWLIQHAPAPQKMIVWAVQAAIGG